MKVRLIKKHVAIFSGPGDQEEIIDYAVAVEENAQSIVDKLNVSKTQMYDDYYTLSNKVFELIE